jgi:hypothetical protein
LYNDWDEGLDEASEFEAYDNTPPFNPAIAVAFANAGVL